MRKPCPASRATQSPERAVVLDVGHAAALVVHLDVRRAVPVATARDQPGLARVVGEASSGSGG